MTVGCRGELFTIFHPLQVLFYTLLELLLFLESEKKNSKEREREREKEKDRKKTESFSEHRFSTNVVRHLVQRKFNFCERSL